MGPHAQPTSSYAENLIDLIYKNHVTYYLPIANPEVPNPTNLVLHGKRIKTKEFIDFSSSCQVNVHGAIQVQLGSPLTSELKCTKEVHARPKEETPGASHTSIILTVPCSQPTFPTSVVPRSRSFIKPCCDGERTLEHRALATAGIRASPASFRYAVLTTLGLFLGFRPPRARSPPPKDPTFLQTSSVVPS